MRAGALNRRISIQAQSTDQDPFGQPVVTWQTVQDTWASIDIQTSALIYSTAEFIQDVTYKIAIRWTPIILRAGNRIIYSETATEIVHTFEIKALWNDKQQDKQLNILAHEINGAA